MTAPKLKYLSTATVDSLRENIAVNIERYRSGDFSDLMQEGEWDITLDVQADLEPLAQLDPAGTPEAEISNSRLVWEALQHLTPTLACEEGIWTRLTHVECLPFARARWIGAEADDNEVAKSVQDHFFAATLTSRRDDNAISRLWWNAYIASLAAPGPGLAALDLILKKADIRSNFVERSLTASRPPLAAGIVRIMEREQWVTGREENFRAFMRTLNRLGGGMLFEVMPEGEIDDFMVSCATRAGLRNEQGTEGTAA
jgi:hypothetical protein